MRRPLIHLVNPRTWGAGPRREGRVYSAMRWTPPPLLKALAAGWVEAACPDPDELAAVLAAKRRRKAGTLPDAEWAAVQALYRAQCVERFLGRVPQLRPGVLADAEGTILQPDDGVFCGCPEPGSPARQHACHLEDLAPALFEAGWEVWLHNERRVYG